MDSLSLPGMLYNGYQPMWLCHISLAMCGRATCPKRLFYNRSVIFCPLNLRIARDTFWHSRRVDQGSPSWTHRDRVDATDLRHLCDDDDDDDDDVTAANSAFTDFMHYSHCLYRISNITETRQFASLFFSTQNHENQYLGRFRAAFLSQRYIVVWNI